MQDERGVGLRVVYVFVGLPTCYVLAGSLSSMKLFKVFFVFLLLGGDYRLEPASLEAFPQQPYGCDGRATGYCN